MRSRAGNFVVARSLGNVPFVRRGIAVLVWGLSLAFAAPGHAEHRYFTTEQGVRLGDDVEATLERIGREYHRRTGRRLHVTSGTRTPREQAEAMYEKLQLGEQLTRTYRDFEAASEIQAAYRSHRRHGRAACVRAIAQVIRRQLRRGCYISRHLHASAVDVRSRDMSPRQQRVFREIVAGVEGVELLQEGRPPHFHLQM